MAKNIVICSDGTGNTAIKGRGTNVFKLFEAVDLNGHRSAPHLIPQVAIYDDGVGTEGFLPLKLLGGAFGWGLKRNVVRLYTGLVRIYDPGDSIYLFGFSRGAFTVRTLAGMIAKCGILDWNYLPTTDAMRTGVHAAYRAYREAYRTWLYRVVHGKGVADVQGSAGQAIADFRDHHRAHDAQIHFIGVWDTVDAVGGPFHIADLINNLVYRFKFPDHTLSDRVNLAVHALSIDDARAAFEPVLWEADERVEQVWFAGVHSNVGGGYPKQGMSLVALDWMLDKAARQGLRILRDDRQRYREHGSVDDKLYNSRAGLGVCYRWKPRNMAALSAQQKAGSIPKLHLSVLERIAHGTDGYAPGSLALNAEVVYTPTGDPFQDNATQVRAQEAQRAFTTAFQRRGADLAGVSWTPFAGRIAYYLFAGSCVGAILDGSFLQASGARAPVSVVVAFGLIASTALAMHVKHRRSLVFSRFWHDSRHELRDALKAAREKLQLSASSVANRSDSAPDARKAVAD